MPVTARVLLALLLCATTPPALTQIYKSVDEDGKTVFSDTPSGNAEAIELGPVNSMQPPEGAPRDTDPQPAEPAQPYYHSLTITSPQDGGSVNNPGGNVVVLFTLDPPLRDGDTARLLVDGTPGGVPAEGGLLAPGNARGDHVVEVQVLDPSGTVLRSSAPVHVTVFRSPVRDKPGRPPRSN
jgi:hypothetical protein